MNRLARMAIFITIMLAFGVSAAYADSDPIRIDLDGTEIECDSPPVIVEGRTLIPARAVFEAMGGEVSWDQDSREVTVEVGTIDVKLKIDSKTAYINGTADKLEVPAQIILNRTMLPVRFVSEAVGYKVSWDEKNRIVGIFSPEDPGDGQDSHAVSEEDRELLEQYGLSPVDEDAWDKIVVIDPGHGGADTGSRGYENGEAVLDEKDVNLDVALRLQKMLEAAGAEIYMIRTEDITIPLYERQDTANLLGASLYVAIHNNSYTSGIPNGTEVHYHGDDDPAIDGISAQELANDLQETLVENLGLIDRGTKASPELAVLRRTIMPAVIIEGAFISNENDLNYMKTDEFREKYAESTAKCIIDALNNSVEQKDE